MPPSCLPTIPGTADNELIARYTPGPTEEPTFSDNAILQFRFKKEYCAQGDNVYRSGETWTDTEVKILVTYVDDRLVATDNLA